MWSSSSFRLLMGFEDEPARRAYGVPNGVNNVLIINASLFPNG